MNVSDDVVEHRTTAGTKPPRVLPATRSPARIAFALEGGASYGAVHVGMLAALTEAGIRPTFLVGSSVGALNAAVFAASGATSAGVDALRTIWTSTRRSDVIPLRLRPLLRGLLRRQEWLIPDDPLRAFIARWVPFAQLEDAPLPVHIVATDLDTGDIVVLSDGPTGDAILASSAMPGLFPPVVIGSRRLIDGGVSAVLPVLPAVELGATTVFALPTTSGDPTFPRTPLGVLRRSSDLLVSAQTRRQLDEAGGRALVHVLPAPEVGISMFDTSASEQLITASYDLTRRWLQDNPVPVR